MNFLRGKTNESSQKRKFSSKAAPLNMIDFSIVIITFTFHIADLFQDHFHCPCQKHFHLSNSCLRMCCGNWLLTRIDVHCAPIVSSDHIHSRSLLLSILISLSLFQQSVAICNNWFKNQECNFTASGFNIKIHNCMLYCIDIE